MIEFYYGDSGFSIDKMEDLKYLVDNDLVENMLDIMFALQDMKTMEPLVQGAGIISGGQLPEELLKQIFGKAPESGPIGRSDNPDKKGAPGGWSFYDEENEN
jgi:hypothetical protein